MNPIDVIANALGTLDGYPTRWKDDDDVTYALRSDATVVWAALVEHGETYYRIRPGMSAFCGPHRIDSDVPVLVLPMPGEES